MFSEGYRPEKPRRSFWFVLAVIVAYGVTVSAWVCVGVYWLKALGISR